MPFMSRYLSVALVVGLASVMACADKATPASKDSAIALLNRPVTTVKAVQALGADRDFLRSLGDRHKGMIALAHLTKESPRDLAVKPLAVRIDNEHDGEIDQIVTMLERDYKDPYTPRISAADQAALNDLKTKDGAAYDRAFLEHTIAHCTEARAMIDAYLPAAASEAARALATSIRGRLDKEIPEFTAMLAKSAPARG